MSNVVNGYAFVKADNRRRVEEALAATGYRPNLGARNLRRGRTGFIGLMVPELSVPYFAGEGGVTPPGGNVGLPGSLVDGWTPDLRKQESRVTFAMLIKL